jgi:hypothetical protein
MDAPPCRNHVEKVLVIDMLEVKLSMPSRSSIENNWQQQHAFVAAADEDSA